MSKANVAPKVIYPMPDLPPTAPAAKPKSERGKLWMLAERNRWPLSVIASIALHGIVAGVMMINWSFHSHAEAPPPAAMVVELAVMPASPPIPATEIPPGPQQVEAAPKPKPLDRLKFDPPPQVDSALKPNFALPVKQEIKPQDSQVEAKEARQTTAPQSVPAPPKDKSAAPVEGSNSAPPSDAQQGWLSQVLARMVRNKRYPAQAQSAGQEDVVYVRMIVDRKGRLIEAALKKAGKYQLLDAETLALAKRASPFPAPPASMTGERIAITVPVEFFIKKRH